MFPQSSRDGNRAWGQDVRFDCSPLARSHAAARHHAAGREARPHPCPGDRRRASVAPYRPGGLRTGAAPSGHGEDLRAQGRRCPRSARSCRRHGAAAAGPGGDASSTRTRRDRSGLRAQAGPPALLVAAAARCRTHTLRRANLDDPAAAMEAMPAARAHSPWCRRPRRRFREALRAVRSRHRGRRQGPRPPAGGRSRHPGTLHGRRPDQARRDAANGDRPRCSRTGARRSFTTRTSPGSSIPSTLSPGN